MDKIAKVVAWAHECRTTNLSSSLSRNWAAMHQLVMEEDCPPLEGNESELVREGACRAAGRCVCTGPGRQLHLLRSEFIASMKKVFRPGSSQRESLVSGRIVVRLTGETAAGAPDAPQALPTDVFLHIGLMFLSPYRPTFMLVEATEDLREVAVDGRRLYIRAPALGTIVLCSEG